MNIRQRLGIELIRAKIKVLTIFSKRKTAEKAFELVTTPLSRSVSKDMQYDEALSFTLDGLTVRGFRWNHPQAKRALILHGFSSAAFKFEIYVQPLVAKGYEVLAFDAPGHGISDGKTMNAIVYSNMIRKVMELYGPINSFIAHSFGGLGLSLALEQTPHNNETKVVLVAPATETTAALTGAYTLLGIKDSRVKKEVDNIIYEKSGRQPSWLSIRRAVHHITAQILWIHDEDDEVTPLADAVKAKEDNHAHINFVITKGLGHNKIYRDEAVKKMIIDFL